MTPTASNEITAHDRLVMGRYFALISVFLTVDHCAVLLCASKEFCVSFVIFFLLKRSPIGISSSGDSISTKQVTTSIA